MNEANPGKGKVLVAGATGQVGSQAVKILLGKGYPVRALVRRTTDRVHGAGDGLEYAVGSLEDRASLERALVGIETVVSSANAIIPSGRTMTVEDISASGYEAFISAAERAGVRHWIQSSVPSHAIEGSVPELAGKRVIEARLEQSPIASTIVRNPAFTDVWMVMTGAANAANSDPHATTSRPYGFMRFWQRLTGNLVAERGILLAPGGANHGAPFVTVEDVAHMMAGMVGKQASYNRTIEAGGPEWLSWREVAELLSEKAGRKVRIIKMPAWFAAMGQALTRPFSPSASNVLALVKFVATYQPRWESRTIVDEFDLPAQMTVRQYIERHWCDG
ncbi:MAG: NmrA family NAD(P)-binding protein [Rhodobacter sp.]|nr:NmrA family NAD(P)-binding protein [Rhodobacter sp.]